MAVLADTVAVAFARRFDAFLEQANTLPADLSEAEFWARPYTYGNSAGHLLLHITGNLNYYIGTRIANTGYVRDRDREFTDTSQRPKTDVLGELATAVAMVNQTIRAQSENDWSAPYSATGTDEQDRFAIVLRCAHHFHHHLGQILYIAREHAVKRGRS
jgi:uncharacterized damage-inducible protein DinB